MRRGVHGTKAVHVGWENQLTRVGRAKSVSAEGEAMVAPASAHIKFLILS